VFGGYVALALWMVQYYVGEYGLDIRVAALAGRLLSHCPVVFCERSAVGCQTNTVPIR
jgi:nitrate/nitrite transporter NarK